MFAVRRSTRAPATAYRACRLKIGKGDPYFKEEETELAESTMISPMAVRSPVHASSSRTTGGLRLAATARPRARGARAARSPSRTRRRWRRGVSRARLATRSSVRAAGDGRAGPAVRDAPGRLGEAVASFAVVAEHVLAGAGRSEEHRAPGRRERPGGFDGLLDLRH